MLLVDVYFCSLSISSFDLHYIGESVNCVGEAVLYFKSSYDREIPSSNSAQYFPLGWLFDFFMRESSRLGDVGEIQAANFNWIKDQMKGGLLASKEEQKSKNKDGN